ncbi:prepilin peptidase [Leucobacter sp. BZR 635]
MARKSRPASFAVDPGAAAPGDLAAAVIGAVAGGAVFTALYPVGGAGWWGSPACAPGEQLGLAWLFALCGHASFGAFSLILARVDLRTQTLPNRLVSWATIVTVPLLAVAGILRGERAQPGEVPATTALPTDAPWAMATALQAAQSAASPAGPITAALVLSAAAAIVWALPGRTLGGGDVKLMPLAVYAAVCALGDAAWPAGAVVFAGAFLFGVCAHGLLTIARKQRAFAAGPLILASSWVTLAAARFIDS